MMWAYILNTMALQMIVSTGICKMDAKPNRKGQIFRHTTASNVSVIRLQLSPFVVNFCALTMFFPYLDALRK